MSLLFEKYGSNLGYASNIEDTKILPTRHAGLNYLIGGGIPLGRVVEVFGPESAGKTATCLHIIKTVQEAYPEEEAPCAFIDGERALVKSYVENLGVDLSRLLYSTPTWGEEALQFAVDAVDDGCRLVIYDSVPTIDPKSTYDKIKKDPEAKDMGQLAAMFNRFKGLLTQATYEKGATIVFINQVRDKMNSPYGGVDTPGGHALKHLYSLRLNLKFASTMNDRIGITTKFIVKKNRFRPTMGRTCDIEIMPYGLDIYSSALSIGADLKVLTKRGNYFYISEELAAEVGVRPNIGNGINNAARALASNQELFNTILNEINLKIESLNQEAMASRESLADAEAE